MSAQDLFCVTLWRNAQRREAVGGLFMASTTKNLLRAAPLCAAPLGFASRFDGALISGSTLA